MPKKINPVDLIGKRFGKLVVLSKGSLNQNRSVLYRCLCDCGNYFDTVGSLVFNGITKSCGCGNQAAATLANQKKMAEKRGEMVGRKFGRLVVLGLSEIKNLKAYYYCTCDCGEIVEVNGTFLTSGSSQSCGCYGKEIRLAINTKHELCNHRLYGIWRAMIRRCYNPNSNSFENYGMRGIKICDQWRKNFKIFYDWAISNGYGDNLTIERIDVNGNYEPNNCTWITRELQNRNKRNSKITLEDARAIRIDTRSYSKIAADYNISDSHVHGIKHNNVWKE